MTWFLALLLAVAVIGAAGSVVTAYCAVSLVLRLRGIDLPVLWVDIAALWHKRRARAGGRQWPVGF